MEETSQQKIVDNIEKKIEQRKEKIKSWFESPYNLALIGIIIFAFVIRFYYFWLTKNQPLWWDEAEYMSAAKSYAGIGYFELGSWRLPFFPLLMSLFFRLGLTSEPIMRFFGLFLPSLIVIFLAYLVLSKMYNKKTGIISALILTVLWEHVFYSNRFHTENLALIFEFLAIYFCIVLWQNGKNWDKKRISLNILLVIFLCFLSITSRPGNLIFVPAVFGFLTLYLIFSSRFTDRIKDIIIVLILIALPIVYFILTTSIIPNSSMLSNYYHPDMPIGWNSLTVFNGMYLNSFPGIIFFITFLIGFVFAVSNLFLNYGIIKKRFIEDKEFSFDILNLMILISVMFAMIFMLRANQFEYRWFFPLLPGMLAFTSKGIVSFSNFIEKILKIKNLSIILIMLILVFGIYPQIIHTDKLIKVKLNSYEPVKDSGLWIKENSNPEDSIISASITQHSYYTERKVYNLNWFDELNFTNFIKEKFPKYVVISIFESHPSWAYTFPERHNDTLTPIKVYSMHTSQGEQPVLVIYEIKK